MSDEKYVIPVSIEQIAAVICQMSQDDQEKLLELTPALCQTAVRISANPTQSPRDSQVDEIQAVFKPRTEVPTRRFLGI